MELNELLEKGRALNKEKKYNEVIEMLPDDVLEEYNAADLYAEKAEAYFRVNKNKLCYLYAEIGLTLDPMQPTLNYLMGVKYNNLKKYDKAIKFYEVSMSSERNSISAHVGLGSVYRKLGQYEKAIESFMTAIRLDKNNVNPAAYYGLGLVYTEQKKYSEAILAYNKAIKVNSKYKSPYYALGVTYFDLKEYKKAVVALEKGMDISPTYNNLYFVRAKIFSEWGKYQEAVSDYERYILYSNDSDQYYVSLAESEIIELKKLIDSTDYSGINTLVEKIKNILLFKGNCVTHYTSLSSARNLILNNSRFRLSEGTFLNDTSEGRELFNFLNFFSEVDSSNQTIDQPFTQKPFIGSFVSENMNNNLTLWRMYGKEDKEEAKGCAITLEKNILIKEIEKLVASKGASELILDIKEFSFYKVAYRIQNTKQSFIVPGAKPKEINELNRCMVDLASCIAKFKKSTELNNGERGTDTNNVIELLNSVAFLFKSAEYQHEQELRLVVKGIGFKKKGYDYPPLKESDLPRVYIELIDIASSITKITLGPKVEKADEWGSAFYYKLALDDDSRFDEKNIKPKIIISILPYK